MSKCPICGKEIAVGSFDHSVFNSTGMCSSCDFWKNRLEADAQLPPHTAVMIDGTHYVVGDENSPETYFRGFGGHRFQIEFKDGHRIVSTNLWCQGEPTPAWRNKFPDNARFETNLKWVEIEGTHYLVKL